MKRESRENPVHPALVVTAVFKVLLVSQDLLVLRVFKVNLDPPVQLDLKDVRVTRVKPVALVLLGLMVNRDSMELPDLVEYRARSDPLERKVIRAPLVLQGLQVRLES